MMKKSLFAFTFIFCLCLRSFSQQEDLKAQVFSKDTSDVRVRLAMSSPDYPVTAGDVYRMSYAAGSQSVVYSMTVDSSYKLKVANLAVIDCKNKTFINLRKEVEDIVSRNYSLSGAKFELVQPSAFIVYIKNPIDGIKEEQAWPLMRLSEVVLKNETPYTSLRDVTVISSNGTKRVYDLFKAERDGNFLQNPYLRPQDTIVLSKANRKIHIGGEVYKPGTYELLKGENLKEAVNIYAGGLTDSADITRMILVRTKDSESLSGNTIYLNASDLDKNYSLNNKDIIKIPSYADLRPSIIVEGIIKNPEVTEELAQEEIVEKKIASYKRPFQFYEGENYATFVRRICEEFTNFSDLENAYIIREGQKIKLDIARIIRDFSIESDVMVLKNDRLIIPYSQAFTSKILINGEVKAVIEHEAWPLKRLSDHLADCTTEYSSLRNIELTDPEGKTIVCDLFRASRFGEMEQNPYVQAGCIITLNRYERKININGAVERPGTYELLKGENLKEAVNIYAGGFINRADTERIEINRYTEVSESSCEKIYISKTQYEQNYELINYDSVKIYSFMDLHGYIFVEGSIITEQKDTGLVASDKKVLTFEKDEDYAYLIRNNKGIFTDSADLKAAYIVRDEQIIPLDLAECLYNAKFVAGIIPMMNDKLVVPFEQSFVIVAGAVNVPGRYPYIPDRTWEYYVGLAGGFDETKNSHNVIYIKDKNNKKVSKKDQIEPEMTITAQTNSFTYYFGRYAPLVTTTLSVLSVLLTLYIATK